jgi:hypothetical protein
LQASLASQNGMPGRGPLNQMDRIAANGPDIRKDSLKICK